MFRFFWAYFNGCIGSYFFTILNLLLGFLLELFDHFLLFYRLFFTHFYNLFDHFLIADAIYSCWRVEPKHLIQRFLILDLTEYCENILFEILLVFASIANQKVEHTHYFRIIVFTCFIPEFYVGTIDTIILFVLIVILGDDQPQ